MAVEKGPASKIERFWTTAQYYESLALIEEERAVLEEIAVFKGLEGFSYLDHTVYPVVPVDEHCYLPPGSADFLTRLQMGFDREVRLVELKKKFGVQNVWLGPQVSNQPAFPEFTESEQRGFWIRSGN